MRIAIHFLTGLLLIAGLARAAAAASLQVTPVHVEVAAPGSGTSLSVQNMGGAALNVQLRVFKWLIRDGRAVLLPTTDVVASPPATRIRPGAVHTVRLVRVARRPVLAEESYRLLVDEIPVRRQASVGNVSFLLRYSIPVFFTPEGRTSPRLSWRLRSSGKNVSIAVTNAGGRRLRVSSLKVAGPFGRAFAERKGLVGYVLRGATARWTLPLTRRLRPGTRVKVTATGDTGPIVERTVVQARR